MNESGEPQERRVLAELERRLRGEASEAEPALAERAAAWHDVVERLAAARVESFEPGFARRVVERLERERAERSLHLHLERMFIRVAAAGVAAALLLGAYNVVGGDLGAGVVETAFGVPAADFDSAILLAAQP